MIVNRINSLLSTLRTAYNQQGQAGKILIPALFLFVFCCLCFITFSLFPRRSASSPPPTPNRLPTDGAQPTPTALFDFDFPTFTPFPTLPPPSAFPTLTPLPTETQTLTPSPSAPTATGTPLPTNTPTQVLPSATATSAPPVVIIAVHKVAENVDIQNVSSAAVDLAGWRLVSQTGNQVCNLSGTLGPNKVLRIWADRGPGFDCGLQNEVWRDNEDDPAILYNVQGEEVSRFP